MPTDRDILSADSGLPDNKLGVFSCGRLTSLPAAEECEYAGYHSEPAATTTQTNTIGIQQVNHHILPLGRPQNFFRRHPGSFPYPDSGLPTDRETADFNPPVATDPQFCHTQTGKFLLPVINSGLRNPHISAHFFHPGAVSACFSAKAICSSV